MLRVEFRNCLEAENGVIIKVEVYSVYIPGKEYPTYSHGYFWRR
jgi:hypothetical protein